MTAETLHDALTQLPADLVAETDRKRSSPRKFIPWKRYAAMAACFALVVCSSWFCMTHLAAAGKEEAAAEVPMMQAQPSMNEPVSDNAKPETASAAPAAEEAPAEDLQAEDLQADSAAGLLQKEVDATTSFRTPRDKAATACFTGDPRITLLKTRTELNAYVESYDWQYRWADFTAHCEAYDESWFDSHDLLLLAVHHVPEEGCTVSAVTQTDGVWNIGISCPAEEDSAFTDWHILVETQKNHIPSEDAVRLIFE